MSTPTMTSPSSNARMDTKTITSLAMLTALAYIVMLMSKSLPQVSGFLQFDLTDTVICIGGFIFGPMSAAIISILIGVLDTLSDGGTGPIGMIMNIISNAIKYTPNGGKIEVFAEQNFHTVTICVKDNGIGIPEKDDPESYSATITMFGVIPTEAIHPDEAYELLKTLADAEIFPHFGMSVNRDRLNETFDYFTSTHYDYYAFQMPDPDETIEMGAEYQIKPMSEETSQYLQDMVANIDRVVLPNADEFRILQNAVEKYIYDYDFTLDTAYDLAVSNLELYYSGTLTPEEEYNLVWNH